MSSLKANTYTVQPSVQVGNPIAPIKPSDLCIKPSADPPNQYHQQPKKITPFSKAPPREIPKTGQPKVFQFRGVHPQSAPAPAGVNVDCSEVVKKPLATENVIASSSTVKKAVADKNQLQKRTISVQAKTDIAMGNEQNRMQNPADLSVQHSTANTQSTAHIPVPVASLNNAQQTQNIAQQPINNTQQQRMASLIPAESREVRNVANNAPTAQHTIRPVPRVVSTSSSKTITGGGPVSGPVKQHISQRATTNFGTRTAVIQSAAVGKGPQQPIVRSVASPIRTMTTTHRPVNPPLAPAGSGHQSHNPTTVQITIHQPPKHTLSNAGSDRTVTNTSHSAPTSHYANPQGSLAIAGGIQPGPQRLVISQSSSGVIQQNRTTAPMGNAEQSRLITANSSNYPPLRKSGRPPGPIGQHDYITSGRKPGPEFNPLPSRPGVSIHTVADQKPPTITGAYFSTAATTSVSVAGNFHPTTINNLDQHQAVFKTHGNIPLSQVPTTAAVPTIISTCRAGASGPSTVVMGGNPPTDSSSISSHNLPRPGVSPSILRKRTHDSANAVVVKKIPGDRLAGFNERTPTSQPASPRHHRANTPLEKDNASQSSTDTAMSSESPNQTVIKPEPVEAIENGEKDGPPPGVSPRKKPRKQLLNTAAQLKERHDSSTEEETETKTDLALMPMPESYQLDLDIKGTSIKDDFVDREGVRWVKMRQRQPNPLLCFYNRTWESRNNHFMRRSDLKVKDERRPVVSELSNQKGIKQKVSGWKFYHLAGQLQEMVATEQSLCERMNKLQKLLPAKYMDKNPELLKLSELAQANRQRCSLTKDQLLEAKSSMFSILDTHKPKILEIIQKNHSKRPVKKKERS